MALVSLLIGTVIPYVTNEIFGAYKEKYVNSGLKKLLFTEDDYAIQLNRVINNTIEYYQKTYPPEGNFPFYHHKETLAQLSKYVLFNEGGKNVLESINFSEIENIDKPTHEQVEHFYNFFVNEIQADEKLKEFYIEENYKTKIFAIYKEVSLVKNIIEDFIKNIPKTDPLIQSWIEQIYDNLQKLKSLTALQEINRFESEVLSKNPISDKNKAFMYFVKGLCLNENMKPKEAIDYFEQACILDSENDSYKTWLLYLQYLFKNSDEVLSDINIALKSNPFDPILNSVITMEVLNKNHVFPLHGTSLSVMKSIRYKRVIYRHYLQKHLLDPALDYFETDNTNINEELKKVSIDNYGYLNFYLQLYLIHLLRKFPNHLFFKVNPELKCSAGLKAYIEYLEKFLYQIKESEKNDLKNLFYYLLQVALFLKDENKTHLDNAYAIFQQNKELITPFYFNLLKFGFSQAGEFERAIKIFDEKENVPEEYYFKSVLYTKLGDETNSEKALITFIQTVGKIDDQNINIVLDTILFHTFTITDLGPFYKKLHDNNISTDGMYKDILIATKGVIDISSKEDSIKILENNFKKICEEPIGNIEVITAYCRVLHSYKLWQGIIAILGNHDLESFDSQGLMIDALWHSKQNSTKLLSILEKLRNSDSPQFDNYYFKEINLNYLLGNWERVEEITTKGKLLFPKNVGFDYYLALSFLNQTKKSEYCQLLSELNLLELRFPNFQTLITGLIKFGEFAIAVEHVYNYAVTNDDPQHRMFFFNIYLFNSEKINLNIPFYCEAGSFVRIQSSSNTMVINSLDNKNIFDKLVEKKVGENFILHDTMTRKDVQYKIIGIHHKYDVLLEKINKEAETPELTGIPMKAFHLTKGGSVDEWNKQLIEMFGKSGDERNTFIEKEFSQYKTNVISFLQLTRSVFNDDILDSYMTVTNSPQLGVRIIPNSAFQKENNEQPIEIYCLDLPTIILFSELQKSLKISFTKKFIISQHTSEYIDGLLSFIQNEKQSKLSLNITSNGVVPFFNQEEFHKQKIETLKNCVDWIKQNCEILTSAEKLNFLVNIQGDGSDVNSLVLSYIDTLSLTAEHKAVLVSDEKIAFGIFHNSRQIVSSECYLKNHCDDLSDDLLYDFLSAKNLIGIHVPLTKAKKIAQMLTNDNPANQNIFQNFSIKNSINSANVITMINVMENILYENISDERKKEIIKNLFESLFNAVYTNENLLQDIINLIKLSLFRLFYNDNPKYQIIIAEMFSVLTNNNVKIDVN